LANFPAALAQQTTGGKESASSIKSNKRKTRFLGTSKSAASKTAQERVMSIVEALNDSPSHNSERIRDAGEMTAMALLNCFNNFPLPEGACEGPSVEEDDYQTLFFVLNNNVIISFSEQDEDEEEARQLARRNKRLLELEQSEDIDRDASDSKADLELETPTATASASAADDAIDDEADEGDSASDTTSATATPPSPTHPSASAAASVSSSSASLASDGTAVHHVSKRKNRPFVRVTIRDCTGKYTWDCRSLYGEPVVSHLRHMLAEKERVAEFMQQLEAEANKTEAPDESTPPSPPAPAPAPPTQYSRSTGNPPLYWEGADYRNADMVQHLLQYLTETLPDKHHSGEALQMSHPLKIDEMCELLDAQYKTQLESKPLQDRAPLPMVPQMVLPDSYFHHCRLFLSHVGLLDEALRKNLLFLKFGKRLKRSIKELDKVNGREMIKIGLIYVRNGQEDQQDILANTLGTQMYTDFVAGLGWTV
jgi:hypothetical protein